MARSNIAPFDGDHRGLPAFRSPPCNFEAEKALLGAILANNNAYDRVSDFLRPEHFADPIHGQIFEALAGMIQRNQIADPVTMRHFFEGNGSLADVGGPRYLAELAASLVSIINVGDYGRLVYDLHLKRQLIDLGEQIVNRAHAGDIDDAAEVQIADAEAGLFDLTSGASEPERDVNHYLDETETVMRRAMESKRGIIGLATEIVDLDSTLSGLCAPDLILLAGRPSMGKTALALCIADNIAFQYRRAQDERGTWKTTAGAAVAFFSLEMGGVPITHRRVARHASVPMENIRRGRYADQAECDRAFEALRLIRNAPLYIETLREPTPQALRSRARRLVRTKGVGLIVVDYLQLMDPGIRTANLREAVTHISRKLKAMATELNVPVLALSQLTRANEGRDDKRPKMNDLRESGALEQDADVILFVHRDAYYMEREKPRQKLAETKEALSGRLADWHELYDPVANIAEIIVEKQRQGPIGIVRARFDGETQNFDNLSDRRGER